MDYIDIAGRSSTRALQSHTAVTHLHLRQLGFLVTHEIKAYNMV